MRYRIKSAKGFHKLSGLVWVKDGEIDLEEIELEPIDTKDPSLYTCPDNIDTKTPNSIHEKYVPVDPWNPRGFFTVPELKQ